MIRCPWCGREIEKEWKVCPGCGYGLVDGYGSRRPSLPVGGPRQGAPFPAAGPAPYQPAPPARYPVPGQYHGVAVPGEPAPAGSPLLGALTVLAGIIIIFSTFLSWVASTSSSYSYDISGSATGWELMRTGPGFTANGFSPVLSSNGAVFFTGFFSLLLGGFLVVAAVITIVRRRPGGIITVIFALLASIIAAFNMVMVYVELSEARPDVGLWLFAGTALFAIVTGVISLSSPG